MKKLVAVYGSLKKGFGNHGLLSDSEMVSSGITTEPFAMISLGGFPGIIDKTEEQFKKRIEVEVYSVTDEVFKRLDRLEGYPSFYNRKLIVVDNGDEGVLDCWIYVLNSTTRDIESQTIYNGDVYSWHKDRKVITKNMEDVLL